MAMWRWSVPRGGRLGRSAALVRTAVGFAVLVSALLTFAPASRAATTINFSTAGAGPFNQQFFQQNGVVFTEGTFVSFFQGSDALFGPVAARASGGFTSLSAQVAPGIQGTATYTLAAYRQGVRIAARSMTVTEDTGDPANRGFGYFTIDIGPLPQVADSFSLSNVFVRSTFGYTVIPFGVASLTFTAPPALPTSKDQCKDGGWQNYSQFKNQGDCVSFAATNGKKQPR